jgi:BolA protein
MNRSQRIQAKISDELSPMHLEVIDESHMHSVPKGAESHFKLIVVSEQFAGHQLLGRHRLINKLLDDELGAGLHALALHTWTPEEWFEKGGIAPDSPECLSGPRAGN